MRTYDYRCKNCNEAFSLLLTDAQHADLGRSLREKRPVDSRSWEHPSCRACDAAELEPLPMAVSRRSSREI